ncbi:gliding motility protein [Streptomyces sp. NPDC059096]|uniref:gliding motility protein n=1 Tax=unclassified Streptomyces TaxID=2593676 RepID=UPI003699001B
MGVFSWFSKRSGASSEAASEAPEAGTAETAPAESDRTEAVTAEGVEIPKQQSAEAAADNEAGKSTRQ